MSINMMRLGDFRFALDTAAYRTLTHRTQYRWASVERVGNPIGKQFVGMGEDTITLAGVIYTSYYDGGSLMGRPSVRMSSMDTLRAMAGNGVAYVLQSGTGVVFGRYCIEAIDSIESVFFPDGTPQKIEFTLTLTFYGDDSALVRGNQLA